MTKTGGSPPWKRVINTKKENPLLLFHDLDVANLLRVDVRDISIRGTWQLDLPTVGPKSPTNLEKYFIKMKGGR